MNIDYPITYILFFIFGTVFGSFTCCQAWRIHEKSKGKKLGNHSVCMSCNHKLAWYDNVPVISWLLLRGKCHYCKKKIGFTEIFAEVSLGLAFLFVALKNAPLTLNDSLFPMCIVLITLLFYWILLVYDAKWGELPVYLMLFPIALSIYYQLQIPHDFLAIISSIGILAGLYYLLYFLSKEQWVGGGDWILCISIAIFLGRPEMAIIELFIANLLASFAAIPHTLKHKDHKIAFGPFLIIGFVMIYCLSDILTKHLVLF